MPVKQKDVRLLFLIFLINCFWKPCVFVQNSFLFDDEVICVHFLPESKSLICGSIKGGLQVKKQRTFWPNLLFFNKKYLISCWKSIAVAAREWQVYPADACERPLRPDLLHRSQREPHRRGQQGQVDKNRWADLGTTCIHQKQTAAWRAAA